MEKKERERESIGRWRRRDEKERGRSLLSSSPPTFELTASETAQPELLFAVDDRRGGSRRGERGEEGGFREEEEGVDGDDSATNAPWRGAGAGRAASPTGLAAARWLHAERLVAMTRRGQEVTPNAKREKERKKERGQSRETIWKDGI